MFVLIRTLIYASLFISLVLIYFPAQLVAMYGFEQPQVAGWIQVVGLVTGTVGAGIAGWSVFTFTFVGKGTPAPFDPPRRLVTGGPYGYVRNPMYIGAGIAMSGAALILGSWVLLGYAVFLFLVTHLFIIFYEEPTLRRMFGEEYEHYCRRVRRWWPAAR